MWRIDHELDPTLHTFSSAVWENPDSRHNGVPIESPHWASRYHIAMIFGSFMERVLNYHGWCREEPASRMDVRPTTVQIPASTGMYGASILMKIDSEKSTETMNLCEGFCENREAKTFFFTAKKKWNYQAYTNKTTPSEGWNTSNIAALWYREV